MAGLLGAKLAAGSRAAPSSDVTFVVPVPAGGGMDATARILAECVRAELGPVVVENKPGAALRLGLYAVRSAPADGSVLLYAPTSPFTIYPHVYERPGFDAEGDFVPVACAASFEFGFAVGPSERFDSLAQYLEGVRSNPRRYSQYGVPGAGSSAHFVGTALATAAGVGLQHVPYRGSAPLMQDLVGGHVPSACNVLGEFIPHRAAGRVRVLAMTGSTRSPLMPDVPTFGELGYPSLAFDEQFGFFAPRGTPAVTVRRISGAVAAALADPGVTRQFAERGYAVRKMSDTEFSRKLAADRRNWGPIVKATGFSLNEADEPVRRNP